MPESSIIQEAPAVYGAKFRTADEVLRLRKELEEAKRQLAHSTRLLAKVQLHLEQVENKVEPAARLTLDRVAGIKLLGDDLRDSKTGRLDATRVAELFSVPMATLAKAAAIGNRQTLQQNPTTEKVQPLLRLFERVARLRSNPQFEKPASLRKWFRRPLPIFSNHSAEDLFKAGKLEVVAEKVDQLLTGDFAG